MTSDAWMTQKARLISHFGKQISSEFCLLVASEINNLPNTTVVEMINAMIGNRKPSNPPLLQDFRDGRLNYERRKFDANVNGAARAMNTPWQTGLKAYLAHTYGTECKTLKQAVEMQIELNRLKRAKEGV